MILIAISRTNCTMTDDLSVINNLLNLRYEISVFFFQNTFPYVKFWLNPDEQAKSGFFCEADPPPLLIHSHYLVLMDISFFPSLMEMSTFSIFPIFVFMESMILSASAFGILVPLIMTLSLSEELY